MFVVKFYMKRTNNDVTASKIKKDGSFAEDGLAGTNGCEGGSLGWGGLWDSQVRGMDGLVSKSRETGAFEELSGERDTVSSGHYENTQGRGLDGVSYEKGCVCVGGGGGDLNSMYCFTRYLMLLNYMDPLPNSAAPSPFR